MPTIRVFHNGTTVIGTEHRLDETYTDENRHPARRTQTWFTADSSILTDAGGHVPFESLIAVDPAGTPALAVDPTVREQHRQLRRDREPGAGGELDQLRYKLAQDTITTEEVRTLLRLERGL